MSGKAKTIISSLAIILAFGAIFALVAYLRNGPLKMFNSEDEQTKECSYLEDKYNERFIKYSEGDTTMYVPESNTAIGVTVTEQEGYLFDDYVEQKTQYELKNDLLVATFVVEREIAQKKVISSKSVTVQTDVENTNATTSKESMQQIEKAPVHDSVSNTVTSIEKNDDLIPMNLEQGVLINDKLR